MSSRPKRSLSTTERGVSPPSIRRKLNKPQQASARVQHNNNQHSSILRIFSWNINGTGPLLQKQISFQSSPTIFPIRAFLKRHNWPDLLCLQEVKIAPQDEVTQRRLQHAANAESQPNEPTYVCHFSLPRDRYNATGFGGKVHGVCTLIRCETAVTSTIKPQWDLEGRVLIHNLQSNIVIINGYWVNGTFNPYRNPTTGIVDGTRHDHKLRFHQYMFEECQKLEREGRSVILIGDMNIARSRIDGYPNLRTSPDQHVKNRYDFNQKFFDDDKGFRGVDVFRWLHGGTKKYTYFPRGCVWGQSCDRVDNIIVSKMLVEKGVVVGTDICDNPGDRGHSDHVPLWVSVDIGKLSHGVKETKEDDLKIAETKD